MSIVPTHRPIAHLASPLAEYLQHHADLVVAELDRDGIVIGVNERSDELAGRALLGTHFSELAPEEQRPALRQLLDHAADMWSCLRIGLFPNAQGVPDDYEVCARRLDDGALVVAQPALRDLETLNSELLTLNQELIETRREVGRQRDALDEQNGRLLELDRFKELERIRTGFLITIAHELRTPLAGIFGTAVTLLRADLDLTRDQRQPFLTTLVAASERLSQVTSEILLASEIASGGLAVELAQVDPLALAGEVAGGFASLPDGIEISVRGNGDALPLLTTDRGRLAHVLANLIDNAIRFSPDGGQIDILVTGTPGKALFRIHDAGIGIPSHERERIFEKFHRIDAEQVRGVGGAGLGLYVCRQLVERLGGRIWVTSYEGEGSAFSVELPFQPDTTTSVRT